MKKLILSLAIVALVAMTTQMSAQGMIMIKGSDTLINLVQNLSEAYMEVDPNTAIAVTGGGSGVGIAALISNTVDIANSSRDIKGKEIAAAKDNGVVAVEVAVAIDGLSVVVNSGLPVESLTIDQIGAIFRGEINNWSEVGGPSKAISLYGRQPSSGTYVFFQEHVLGNKNYSPKMKQMNGNAQIVEGVKSDGAAISYVGIGYTLDENGSVQKGLKVLKVASEKGAEAVDPLVAENVKSGKYPIARALYQYINGKPKDHVKKFVAYELSAEGQKMVEEIGFYPVSGEYKEKNKKAGF